MTRSLAAPVDIAAELAAAKARRLAKVEDCRPEFDTWYQNVGARLLAEGKHAGANHGKVARGPATCTWTVDGRRCGAATRANGLCRRHYFHVWRLAHRVTGVGKGGARRRRATCHPTRKPYRVGLCRLCYATRSSARHVRVDWRSLDEIEAEAIAIAYRLSDFNRSATARRLGISRPTLARKLELHDIKRPPKQPWPLQAPPKRGTIQATIEEMLAVLGRRTSTSCSALTESAAARRKSPPLPASRR